MDKRQKLIFNHLTDGEIGNPGLQKKAKQPETSTCGDRKMLMVHNHDVVNGVPPMVVNHEMKDAAPKFACVIPDNTPACSNDDELAKLLGVFHYPGRALGSTSPGDIIMLHPDLRANWDWISRHYDRCGVSHAKDVIWSSSFQLMSGLKGYEPSVFFFGPRAHASRPDQGWFDVTQEMNSKNIFIEECLKHGLPVPFTACYSSREQFRDNVEFRYPVYLKIAVSVSGLGVTRCVSREELLTQVGKLHDKVPFQVQEELDAAAFINLQYRVNGLGLERVIATEQVLDGFSHNGNRFPTLHAPWHITDPLARMMVKRGIKGYFAFDLAVVQEGRGVRYFLIECNPRYNGSSYPTNIALKLRAPAWMATNFHTKYVELDKLDLGELEYDPERGSGAILVNWGCALEGKLGLLLVGDIPTQEKLMATLPEVL